MGTPYFCKVKKSYNKIKKLHNFPVIGDLFYSISRFNFLTKKCTKLLILMFVLYDF